jgi:hypothetical protein
LQTSGLCYADTIPHVAVRPHYGISQLSASLQQFGSSEVGDFDGVAGTDQDVCWFEISMQYFTVMKVAQANNQLQ